MRKLSIMTAVAALCVAFTAQADAGVYEYPAAKIQIDVPVGWSAAEDDGNLTTASPDGSVAIVIAIMDAKNAKAGAKSLDSVVGSIIADASLTKAKKTTRNGMKGYFRRGEGTLNGAPVELGIMVLATPNKKVIMVLALGVVGMYEQYGDQMNAAIESVSPLRLAMPAKFYEELADPAGERVVKAVLKAIDDNDSAALSKLIAIDFTYFDKEMKARTVKRKAKKKVAKWLEMPDEPFLWEIAAGPAFTIQRGSGYGKTWSLEFFNEEIRDDATEASTWRVSSVYYVDLGAP